MPSREVRIVSGSTHRDLEERAQLIDEGWERIAAGTPLKGLGSEPPRTYYLYSSPEGYEAVRVLSEEEMDEMEVDNPFGGPTLSDLGEKLDFLDRELGFLLVLMLFIAVVEIIVISLLLS